MIARVDEFIGENEAPVAPGPYWERRARWNEIVTIEELEALEREMPTKFEERT